jgi:hypothetical protein
MSYVNFDKTFANKNKCIRCRARTSDLDITIKAFDNKYSVCKNCCPYSKSKFSSGDVVKESYRQAYWVVIDVYSGAKLLDNLSILIDAARSGEGFLKSSLLSREQVFYSLKEITSPVDGPSTVRYIIEDEGNFIPQYYLSKKVT